MNLNTPVHDRLRWSALEADRRDTNAAIMELLLLEECMVRCESLSETIDVHGQEALISDLSECIAACRTYLAAKARESRFESRLRAYCLDALHAAMDASESLHHHEARSCRQVLRAGIKLLRRHRARPAPSRN
jgi:hypothetical protein